MAARAEGGRKLLLGRPLAAEVLREVAAAERLRRAAGAPGGGPGLGILQVGARLDSRVFIRSKLRVCAQLGFRAVHRQLPADCGEQRLLAAIDAMNADAQLHGIVLQLPLPAALAAAFPRAVARIAAAKDVDCLATIGQPGGATALPCVSAAVGEMIDRYGLQVAGRRVVVAGAGFLVGRPVRALFEQRGARVESCTAQSRALTREADILVCATGTPRLFGREDVKEGAVVFDLGISVLAGGRVAGDVDLEDVLAKVSRITPVPGGVGPLTVAVMLRNLYNCYSALTSRDA